MKTSEIQEEEGHGRTEKRKSYKRPPLMDPLLAFRFLVLWDGISVAGVSRIMGLTRNTDVVDFRSGGAPQSGRRIPGQMTYGEIKLERGLIIDLSFEQWANEAWYYPNVPNAKLPLTDFRKDITIQLRNQAGQVMMQYLAFSCWPSDYTALPELDGSGNTVALESMTLQTEGWQRDDSFSTPASLDE